jgi:uncharacterized protein
MRYLVILIATVFIMQGSLFSQKKSRVLVVAGGHRFDTTAFVTMFAKMDGILVDTMLQPRANRFIASAGIKKYDAIVFYDSWKTISEDEKRAYHRLTKRGTGLVFMHHSLVSYQQWDGFKTIIGGKYKKPLFQGDTANLSDYKHHIDMFVQIVDALHPVTKNLSHFNLHDEGYMNIDVLPSVVPLLTTDHPYCHRYLGWYHVVGRSKVVYLLPGHDNHAFANENYRVIVANAVRWTCK